LENDHLKYWEGRFEGNIKMNLKELDCEDWMVLAQKYVQCQALVLLVL